MTDPRGYGLAAAKRVELYSQLAGGNPVNMFHPAADTWTIPAIDGDAAGDNFWFPMKENEFARAGNVPQFNPSGEMPTVVKFNPYASFFTSADDYRVGFLEGYEGPLPLQGPMQHRGVWRCRRIARRPECGCSPQTVALRPTPVGRVHGSRRWR